VDLYFVHRVVCAVQVAAHPIPLACNRMALFVLFPFRRPTRGPTEIVVKP
jgi:hypothetical protein